MFGGMLVAFDMKRKWNPWQIPGQGIDWIKRGDGSLQLWIGGISGTGKIYQITSDVRDDDGAIIWQRYCTYGFCDAMQNQAMQIGEMRKQFGYLTATMEGEGSIGIAAYPESLDTPYPEVLYPITVATPALDDVNVPLNQSCNRLFVEFSVPCWQANTFYNLGVTIVDPLGNIWSVTNPGQSGTVIPTFADAPIQDGSSLVWTPSESIDIFAPPPRIRRSNALGTYFDLQRVVMGVQPEPRIPVSGR
jgi:hypothetical protein